MAPDGRERRLNLGLFGGTFDPPHVGHLAAARQVRDLFELDRLEWVVSRQPPHKPDRPLSEPYHRYAMTVLATLDEAGHAASFRELLREGASYALDTLRAARTERPDARIFFLLGTDQFADLASWRGPQAIVEEFELIVVARPGRTFEEAVSGQPAFVASAIAAGRIRRADIRPSPASSTDVRARVRAGRSVHDLVAPSVQLYMDRYALYRSGG